MADLARACSPASRRTLGVLRFFVAAFCLLLSALYISFGVLYDIEATRYIGAVRTYHNVSVSKIR